MVVCQFLISGCLSISLLISSPNTRVLDICLGNYEQDFLKSSGVQVCTIGKSWQRILCVSSLIIHTVLSSNVLDAIFLYICFNKIKHQTEKVKKMIGEKAYELRKRYVKTYVVRKLSSVIFSSWINMVSGLKLGVNISFVYYPFYLY